MVEMGGVMDGTKKASKTWPEVCSNFSHFFLHPKGVKMSEK